MTRIRTFLTRAAAAAATFGAVAAMCRLGSAAAHASTGYGPYLVVASPSLYERSAPSTSASVVGSLPYHSSIEIACQTSGSLVGASTV